MLFDRIGAKLLPVIMGPRVRARGRQMVSGSRGTTRVSAFSRRECVRVVQVTSAFPEKGRGECRALGAPAVSRAKWVESTRGRHRGFTGATRHSRTQWF